MFLIRIDGSSAQMLERIARNEEKRARLQEQRERERQEQNDRNDDATREKLSKIREVSEGAVSEKAARTLAALQTKEELARQELQRVREAQEKRRCIKAIRYNTEISHIFTHIVSKFFHDQARGVQNGVLSSAEGGGVPHAEDRCGPEEQGGPLRRHQEGVLRPEPHAQQHEGHYGEDQPGAEGAGRTMLLFLMRKGYLP